MADQSTQMSPRLQFFASRICPWIFILLGALAVCLGVLAIHRGNQSLTWPTTQGRIEKASVVDTGCSNPSRGRRIAVSYTFTVDGKTYNRASGAKKIAGEVLALEGRHNRDGFWCPGQLHRCD